MLEDLSSCKVRQLGISRLPGAAAPYGCHLCGWEERAAASLVNAFSSGVIRQHLGLLHVADLAPLDTEQLLQLAGATAPYKPAGGPQVALHVSGPVEESLAGDLTLKALPLELQPWLKRHSWCMDQQLVSGRLQVYTQRSGELLEDMPGWVPQWAKEVLGARGLQKAEEQAVIRSGRDTRVCIMACGSRGDVQGVSRLRLVLSGWRRQQL